MPNQFTTSLWGDEGFSAILSMKSIPEIIEIISRDTSPPLYNITEHIAFQLFGTSEIIIRGLSFFYYCLAIIFIYKITSFLWDRRTGLLAAVFTFLNPFFFIYAFEGRMYSIMALGVAASMYFYLRIIFREPQKGKKKTLPISLIVGYILATAWALYSHHFAFFAVLVQGIGFLIEVGRRRWYTVYILLIAFIGAAILYTPWLIPLYNQTKMVTGGFWLGTPTQDDLKKLIYEYLAKGTYHQLSQTALYLVFATLLVRRWHVSIHKTVILVMWFLVPILATWLLSQKIQSIFYNRYLLYAIPGAMIVLVTNPRKLITGVLLSILVIVFGFMDYHYFTHPTKRPFREVAAYVKEFKRGDDYLIIWNAGSHHLWETKYYGIPAPIYIPEKGGELPFFVGTALMEESDIVSAIPPKTYRVVVITSGSIDEVQVPGYTKLEDQKQFADVKVLWLRK